MIQVVAIITAKSGMREAILKEFHANMPAVHAEKGCIEYGPAIDAEGIGSFQAKFGPDTFVVIEKWESPDALKAHAASPHMAAYAAKTRDMIATALSTCCNRANADAESAPHPDPLPVKAGEEGVRVAGG